MLLDQIGTCGMLLGTPHRPIIIGPLVVMSIFDLLLEPKLFKDLKVDETGAERFPT